MCHKNAILNLVIFWRKEIAILFTETFEFNGTSFNSVEGLTVQVSRN